MLVAFSPVLILFKASVANKNVFVIPRNRPKSPMSALVWMPLVMGWHGQVFELLMVGPRLIFRDYHDFHKFSGCACNLSKTGLTSNVVQNSPTRKNNIWFRHLFGKGILSPQLPRNLAAVALLRHLANPPVVLALLLRRVGQMVLCPFQKAQPT